MISAWLIKIVVGIALVGFAVIELGSPLVARAQADDAAHEVANQAAFEAGRGGSLDAMQARCETVAADKGVEVVQCNVNAAGEVAVIVRKEAVSFLLDRFSATKDWYTVEVSATAELR